MDKFIVYKTVQGDTFDKIALHMYHDEFKASLVIAANTQYLHYITLPANLKIRIPLIEESAAHTLPPWKR